MSTLRVSRSSIKVPRPWLFHRLTLPAGQGQNITSDVALRWPHPTLFLAGGSSRHHTALETNRGHDRHGVHAGGKEASWHCGQLQGRRRHAQSAEDLGKEQVYGAVNYEAAQRWQDGTAAECWTEIVGVVSTSRRRGPQSFVTLHSAKPSRDRITISPQEPAGCILGKDFVATVLTGTRLQVCRTSGGLLTSRVVKYVCRACITLDLLRLLLVPPPRRPPSASRP